MKAEYPNLQLLEYIFRQSLRQVEETGTCIWSVFYQAIHDRNALR